jgi:hypothetical protein
MEGIFFDNLFRLLWFFFIQNFFNFENALQSFLVQETLLISQKNLIHIKFIKMVFYEYSYIFLRLLCCVLKHKTNYCFILYWAEVRHKPINKSCTQSGRLFGAVSRARYTLVIISVGDPALAWKQVLFHISVNIHLAFLSKSKVLDTFNTDKNVL